MGLRELKQALAIHLEVMRRHPTVSAFRDDLARTYAEIGDLGCRAGDRASALRSVRRGLEIREGLARDNPGVFWYQNQVAASHLNIGIIESESGDCAAAERSYRLARSDPVPPGGGPSRDAEAGRHPGPDRLLPGPGPTGPGPPGGGRRRDRGGDPPPSGGLGGDARIGRVPPPPRRRSARAGPGALRRALVPGALAVLPA